MEVDIASVLDFMHRDKNTPWAKNSIPRVLVGKVLPLHPSSGLFTIRKDVIYFLTLSTGMLDCDHCHCNGNVVNDQCVCFGPFGGAKCHIHLSHLVPNFWVWTIILGSVHSVILVFIAILFWNKWKKDKRGHLYFANIVLILLWFSSLCEYPKLPSTKLILLL